MKDCRHSQKTLISVVEPPVCIFVEEISTGAFLKMAFVVIGAVGLVAVDGTFGDISQTTEVGGYVSDDVVFRQTKTELDVTDFAHSDLW